MLKETMSSIGLFNVVCSVEDGRSLVTALATTNIDVVLLDIKMPYMSGIEVLSHIYEKYPNVKVIILSCFEDDIYIGECLQYGINAYLTKNCELSELIKAVKLAEANEVYFSRHMMNGCAKKYIAGHRKRVSDMLPNFSLEEIKIVQLLKNEYTTDEIASSMGLSRRSIEIKIDKIKERTNIKSKIGIALYFIKRGLIE